MSSLVSVLESKDAEQFRPFFEGCANGALLLPRCTACQAVTWYPHPLCACGSDRFQWTEFSTDGTLFSYCVVRRRYVPDLTAELPIVPAIVTLREAGVRLVSAITDAEPEDLAIDRSVTGYFGDPFGHGLNLIYFRPA
jgi:uncharacterized OB-fold protein